MGQTQFLDLHILFYFFSGIDQETAEKEDWTLKSRTQ